MDNSKANFLISAKIRKKKNENCNFESFTIFINFLISTGKKENRLKRAKNFFKKQFIEGIFFLYMGTNLIKLS